jgi:sterol desaturase/sphingolipid hydroxylase (fatty acid hydroxylase superfamily)
VIGEALIANKGLIGAAAFVALFVLERAFAADHARGGWARLRRNGVLWASLFILSPLIVLPLATLAAEHPVWARPDAWPAAATLLADIVILDLWAYLVHRAYHEVPLMRRLHRVHHLDQHLDTTSAVRFHPGEVGLSALLRIPPIMLLGVPFAHVVIFETVLLVCSFFHHSNVRLPARFEAALSRVIVTPSIHWVHHHAVAADTNSNYSAIFSFWDRIFRTRSAARRTPGMPMGLQGVADKSAIGLLLLPFRNLRT